MSEKKATPNNEAAPNGLHSEFTGEHQRARLLQALRTAPRPTARLQYLSAGGAEAQRSRVLDALRTGPKSTIQLRRDWDVLAPAARVLELRRLGYEILTHWIDEPTECGLLHRVALYVMMRETGGAE